MRLHDVMALTFPLAPSSPPRGEEGGTVGRRSERMLETPHAMVTQVRYVPNEKSGFLIRLLDGAHAYRESKMLALHRVSSFISVVITSHAR